MANTLQPVDHYYITVAGTLSALRIISIFNAQSTKKKTKKQTTKWWAKQTIKKCILKQNDKWLKRTVLTYTMIPSSVYGLQKCSISNQFFSFFFLFFFFLFFVNFTNSVFYVSSSGQKNFILLLCSWNRPLSQINNNFFVISIPIIQPRDDRRWNS